MNNKIKLRDYEWLHYQYIALNKSYTEICKEFEVSRSSLGRWVQFHKLEKPLADKLKYGSPKVDVICRNCGAQYKTKPSTIENGGGKFCSRKCCSTFYYYNGVGDKMHKGNDEYYKTDRGRTIAIENGKRVSKLLASGYKTSIELALENELTSRCIEFTSQKPYKLGIADIFIEPNIYVFADGDYWHAKNAVEGIEEPTEKQRQQINKDVRQTNYLKASGNVVYRFWESEINADVEACIDVVLAEINEKETA